MNLLMLKYTRQIYAFCHGNDDYTDIKLSRCIFVPKSLGRLDAYLHKIETKGLGKHGPFENRDVYSSQNRLNSRKGRACKFP